MSTVLLDIGLYCQDAPMNINLCQCMKRLGRWHQNCRPLGIETQYGVDLSLGSRLILTGAGVCQHLYEGSELILHSYWETS